MAKTDKAAQAPIIYWITHDLRLADNPALQCALRSGQPVVPVYVFDDGDSDIRPSGGASRWWLHHSLVALTEMYAQRGAELVLKRGNPAAVIPRLAAELGAERVFVQRNYAPGWPALEGDLHEALQAQGATLHRNAGYLLHEPETVATKAGTPFKVFTPFWRQCNGLPEPALPEAAPQTIPGLAGVASETLASFGLLPTNPDWSGGIGERWTPGTEAAGDQLAAFIGNAAGAYDEQRDIPGTAGTSRLSPHLHLGEISVRQVWHAMQQAIRGGKVAEAGGRAWLRELGWREFCHHLLYHFPTLPETAFNPKFAEFPWRDATKADGREALRRWQRGQTGIPLVDAGMRELWRSGWMHNRVRMIVGSFLTKNLLLPWQAGETWFWDTLVDASPANNAAGWQWVSGAGADAAPYFRIFNPEAQSRKFDAEGAYIRRWVPELAALPAKYVHAPWTAPADVLAEAGVTLGEHYPEPLVDLKHSRAQALDAYQILKARAAAKS